MAWLEVVVTTSAMLLRFGSLRFCNIATSLNPNHNNLQQKIPVNLV